MQWSWESNFGFPSIARNRYWLEKGFGTISNFVTRDFPIQKVSRAIIGPDRLYPCGWGFGRGFAIASYCLTRGHWGGTGFIPTVHSDWHKGHFGNSWIN